VTGRDDAPEVAAPDLVTLVEEIQAIGRAGLHYATDPFDRVRYQRLLDLAAATYAEVGAIERPELLARFGAEVGCITPKVGADAVIVDEVGRLLLVLRADDRRWGLISGWVEPNEHPADTVVREAKEEVGLDVALGRLLGVFARTASATAPHSVVSVVYEAAVTGGEVSIQPHEVLEARWWHVDDVPSWHLDHGARARAVLPLLSAGSGDI